MSKFKKGDKVRVDVAPDGYTACLDGKLPFEDEVKGPVGLTGGYYGLTEWLVREDMMTLIYPTFGQIIAPEDIRDGDTIAVTWRDGRVNHRAEFVWDASQDSRYPTYLYVDYEEFNFDESTIYLVNRVERDPEIEAIMTALSVSADEATELHVKGVRIVSDDDTNGGGTVA